MVVCDTDLGGTYGYWAIGYVEYEWTPLIIQGACFPPFDEVMITYCEENYIWAYADANACGAFSILAFSPYGFGYWYDDVISVRAWVDAVDVNLNGELDPGEPGELWANWPLFIGYWYYFD